MLRQYFDTRKFGALLMVTFFMWDAIKSTKRLVMSQLTRQLAEVRRQMKTSMKRVDRLYEHVTNITGKF